MLYRTRVNLAGQGLPMGGGVGLEVFAETPFGMSEFSQRVNYLRALQGELTRTINALSAVQSSRVHLALPRRSATLLDAREHATASVVVSLRPGYWLTPGQVYGITHLVASSVTGLAPEHVTMVDSSGQTLRPVGEKTDRTESERMHDLKVQIEQKLESRIQTMLEPVLGPGRAIARATVELDFQQRQQTKEEFDPAGQVVRSQQREVEEAATPPGGVPGVQANIPGGDSERLQKAEARKSSHITNYDITKTTSQVTAPRGQVRRLSVAVLVDGKYEDGVYIPRSAEEMETLKAVVMRAVGFNADRGDQLEVANIPFSEQPLLLEYAPFDAREWITTPQGIGTAAGVLCLLIVLISMRRRRRVRLAAEVRTEQTQPGARLEQGQQGADSVEVTGLTGERITIEEDPRRAEIIRLAQDNKEFAVQVIRMWLQAEKKAKALAQGAQGEQE